MATTTSRLLSLSRTTATILLVSWFQGTLMAYYLLVSPRFVWVDTCNDDNLMAAATKDSSLSSATNDDEEKDFDLDWERSL